MYRKEEQKVEAVWRSRDGVDDRRVSLSRDASTRGQVTLTHSCYRLMSDWEYTMYIYCKLDNSYTSSSGTEGVNKFDYDLRMGNIFNLRDIPTIA